MGWLLGIAVVFVTLGLLGGVAWSVWRKARRVTSAAARLRGGAEALTFEANALASRLDAVEVGTRLSGVRRG